MKTALWQISVVTSSEAEEPVAALLESLFSQSVSTYANEETKQSIVSIYCEDRAQWTLAKQRALKLGLQQLSDYGLNVGLGAIQTGKVAKEDWSESWKKHFKPIEIGKSLLVKPSWIKQRPLKGQVVVVLDPGLSFGTGNHPTTSFCLEQVVACRQKGSESFWDVGTGSGILAIAAAKLGYKPVHAMDFDPESVRVARQNVKQNKVTLRPTLQDVTRLPIRSRQKYDLICANLISNLLIAEKKRIFNRLNQNGALVLAGILQAEFTTVQKEFEACGLHLTASKVEGEWQSGKFEFISR